MQIVSRQQIKAPPMGKYGKLQDSHFSNFKDRVYQNGVLTLKLTSWEEFHTIAQIFFENRGDYIWRGHQHEKWELKSFFDRGASIDDFIPHNPNRQDKLDEILKKFKHRLKELPHRNIDAITEDEIWAIGQHHGLPTPLLDWTECPYIAAFMAFRKKVAKSQSDNRVVYALNKALKLLMAKNKLKKKCRTTGGILSSETISRGRFVEFLDLSKTSDQMQNERLKNQKGRFTKALDGIDIKTNILKFMNSRKEIVRAQEVILAEILIPEKEREKCLNYLRDEKDITHGRLFPDYAGAVEICKNDLGIRNLMGNGD
jgi:hypothetical protein